MKLQSKTFISVFLTLVLLAGWITPANANGPDVVSAQVDMPTPTPTPTETPTPTPTNTPPAPTDTPKPTQTSTPTLTSTPTTATPVFGRPQVVIASYSSNNVVQTGKKFKVSIRFTNRGTLNAINTQAVFTSSDVVPTGTGGVLALAPIPMGETVDAEQSFFTSSSTSGKSVVVIDVTLTYYDNVGTSYSDKFTLSVPAKGEPTPSSGGGTYATSTPSGPAAQLVITDYTSDVDPLQPGQKFKLGITVRNMGKTSAKQVTMIVGGGSSGSSSSTPQPGGVSGGSGEFTNFAPVGTSNIQALGELVAGGTLQVWQNLVVNVSTNPGAYPVKITFSYINSKGEMIDDEQVITLLVYSLPNLDVSFYTPPQPFFVEQPGALPIQVVNLGKRSAILGNMKIETEGGMVEPATTLVGSIDAGGYFTFDSMLTPNEAGLLKLNVTIEYMDDFNQPRTVTKPLDVAVEEAFNDPAMEGMGGTKAIMAEETLLQKVWRFVLGVFGLDSAPAVNDVPTGEPSFDEMPAPVPSGGGGKG